MLRTIAWSAFAVAIAIPVAAWFYIRVEMRRLDELYPFPRDADASLVGLGISSVLLASIASLVGFGAAIGNYRRSPAPRGIAQRVEFVALTLPFLIACVAIADLLAANL